MTSQGVERDGLYPFKRYNSYIACYQSSNAYIDGARRNPQGLNPIVNMQKPSTTIGFKYFNFSSVQELRALILNSDNKQAYTIKVYAARSQEDYEQGNHSFMGEKIVTADQCTGRHEDVYISCSFKGLTGKYAVFVEFNSASDDCCDLYELEFVEK